MCSRVAHTWEIIVDTLGALTTSETVEMGQWPVAGQCLLLTAQIQTIAVHDRLMPDLLFTECSTRGENEVPSSKHVEV
jgi:hypothetical protein